MKFTVERSKWLRGEGPGASRLLRSSDGKMCCIGFFCLASGMPPETIIEISTYALAKGHSPDTDPFSGEIYQINDDIRLNDNERETKLKFEFAKLGHEVEFV